ncbi:MAG: glycosyltransferase family 2 protein, partial [Kiritimatiellia bacterium]
ATVTDDGFPWYRVKYKLPSDLPPVAVIIPFKDGISHLRRLTKSLRQTTWPDYHLHLVDNQSRHDATREYLASLDPHGCTIHT